MRWRVVGSEPDEVEVYDAERNLLCRMNATIASDYSKLYDGFEGHVHRVLATINPQRPLPQDMGFYLRLIFRTLGPKRVTSASMQIKNIK
jgi:hypothetical protein